MSQRQPFQTDFARPAALPTASLASKHQSKDPELDVDSDVYLDKLQEEWNKKIDEHVQILVDNMVDIVQIASVGTSVACSRDV
jgi:mediator of RNA polymerase II transcription subunit 22